MNRRPLLLAVVASLFIADVLLLTSLNRPRSDHQAGITFIGLDSAEVLVPTSMRFGRLAGDRWDVWPIPTIGAALWGVNWEGGKPTAALVTLAPDPTLGQAIRVFRSLKAHHVCNVLIREAGKLESAAISSDGRAKPTLSIPSIVLCGRPIGDAGFSEALPPDGPL